LRVVLLDRFTFSPLGGAIGVAACGVITVLLLHFMHKYADRLSEKRTLVVIALGCGQSAVGSTPYRTMGFCGYSVALRR
jgi:hypothetical protein